MAHPSNQSSSSKKFSSTCLRPIARFIRCPSIKNGGFLSQPIKPRSPVQQLADPEHVLGWAGDLVDPAELLQLFAALASSPSLQAWWNTSGPSSSMCSFNRKPGAARESTRGECSLARAQRLKAKVITIDLDQVEGPHEDALVIPSVSDAIER